MIKNAKIKSTLFGREEHGLMTFRLYIDFDLGMSCVVGGYVLDQYDPNSKTRVFNAKSMEVISKILDVVGVNSWEELPGKYIRFEEYSSWGPVITKIGNIIEDKWIDFEEFFEGEK